jgi:hypothetical protein
MAGVSALEAVRLAFSRLAMFSEDFDLAHHDREYADRLVELWDDRLRSLARYSTDASITAEAREALRFLTDAISRRPQNGDEFLQWLAVFPETAAGLFSPGELTYRASERDQSEAVTPRRRRRQAALALAA